MEKIGITFQGIDANKCINEIYHTCVLNNISIKMEIQLENNDIKFICL